MAEPLLKRQRVAFAGEELQQELSLREVLSEADVNNDVVAELMLVKHRALSIKDRNPAAISNDTIVELLKRESLVTGIINGKPPLEDINAQVQDLKAHLAAAEERFKAHVDAQVGAAEERFKAHVDGKMGELASLMSVYTANTRARIQNSSATGACKLIAVKKEKPPSEASPAAVGTDPPPNMPPVTAEAVMRLTHDQVSDLERFYGEEFPGDSLERCRAVGAFLGMRVGGV